MSGIKVDMTDCKLYNCQMGLHNARNKIHYGNKYAGDRIFAKNAVKVGKNSGTIAVDSPQSSKQTQQMVFSLKKSITDVLPQLEEDKVHSLVTTLNNMGVNQREDLDFVKEGDLNDITTIQKRQLLRAWKSGNNLTSSKKALPLKMDSCSEDSDSTDDDSDDDENNATWTKTFSFNTS